MERYSSSDSNISLDSLEIQFKKKLTTKKKISDENVETILVPFYEKDVLIKVPKVKKTKNSNENHNIFEKFKKEPTAIKNYLVNKDSRKSRRTSYLEIFRKQFTPMQSDIKHIQGEIRSISPEYGDTERESFAEDINNPNTDFLNTEAYNEMYYEKLINQELNNYLEQSYENQLKFTDNIRSKSPEDFDENNLKSVSDVSQSRRHIRRATVQPIQNVKLGGLGPDMENIKPRLERARSLQRYSEKVRMENRVRIYKKSVQEDVNKNSEKEKQLTLRRQESAKSKERNDTENSYLINKNIQDKQSKIVRRMCNSQSKSANLQRTRERDETKERNCVKISTNNQNTDNKKPTKNTKPSKMEIKNKGRIKSCDGNKDFGFSDIKQVPISAPVPPLQISFLVNMGGIRPSSALRTLEAKHRMYQEKVKAFTLNNSNDNDS